MLDQTGLAEDKRDLALPDIRAKWWSVWHSGRPGPADRLTSSLAKTGFPASIVSIHLDLDSLLLDFADQAYDAR